MAISREQLEEREHRILAPAAQRSAFSRGRVHNELPPQWRTQFQRDRDRVIHSRAFRRLEYKTQVFLNGTGDHLRTRLTHTIEVAAISRNIARALQLNEDLAETIALAHDLGHPPFGHKGESMLNRQMRDHGGFDHNRQSLRIVELLEQKYPTFPGLNLSWEVLEGLDKHRSSDRFEVAGQTAPFCQPSLEAQIADVADEITYSSHDLDDGLESGLLQEQQLNSEVKVWAQAARAVTRQFGKLPDESRRYYIIREIIDQQVTDVVLSTEKQLERVRAEDTDAIRRSRTRIVRHSPACRQLNRELRKFLHKHLYNHPEVADPNNRAVRMLGELFRYYLEHPKSMGAGVEPAIEREGIHRAVCDYLASMTDRFCIEEHQRWLGLYIGGFRPR